jgi:hypothetical protein
MLSFLCMIHQSKFKSSMGCFGLVYDDVPRMGCFGLVYHDVPRMGCFRSLVCNEIWFFPSQVHKQNKTNVFLSVVLCPLPHRSPILSFLLCSLTSHQSWILDTEKLLISRYRSRQQNSTASLKWATVTCAENQLHEVYSKDDIVASYPAEGTKGSCR